MRKLLILLTVVCLLCGSTLVCAENYYQKDTISCAEARVITIPRPEGAIDEGWVYFTQEFTFVPEVDGTYRFLVRYEDDENDPYVFYMDVAGEYREIPNGCEFEGRAGESYLLCFQYPVHDGRYPAFTLYVTSDDIHDVPTTGDPGALLPAVSFLLSGTALALLIPRRKKTI